MATLNSKYNTNAVLAGAGSVTSPAFPMAGAGDRRISGGVYASHAGTLNIQVATAAGTFVTVQTIPVSAAVPVLFDFVFPWSMCRINYVNGATLQTEFQLEVYGGS